MFAGDVDILGNRRVNNMKAIPLPKHDTQNINLIELSLIFNEYYQTATKQQKDLLQAMALQIKDQTGYKYFYNNAILFVR